MQPDKGCAEAQVNSENGLMRYEFLELLCRAGIAKYGKGQATDSVAEAMRMLLAQNLKPNLSPGSGHVSNDFRHNRLYCEEVDLLLKPHAAMLRAIYSRYFVWVVCTVGLRGEGNGAGKYSAVCSGRDMHCGIAGGGE